MNIFAMDTSSLTATAAILSDEKLIGEFTVSNKLTHSATIMPMTDTLLKTASLTLDDIDVFAVSVGPGSFTGLRIGMATVKTLAQAKNKPIIGVSSLRAVSESFAFTDCIICPMTDARRDEVYNALYLNGEELEADRALHIDALLDSLAGKKVIFAGDGVLIHRERIEARQESGWRIAPPNLLLPKASSVAYAALGRALKNDFDDVYTLNPVYLRKSQAEREREQRRQAEEKRGGNEK